MHSHNEVVCRSDGEESGVREGVCGGGVTGTCVLGGPYQGRDGGPRTWGCQLSNPWT